jgi:hypothetical protein
MAYLGTRLRIFSRRPRRIAQYQTRQPQKPMLWRVRRRSDEDFWRKDGKDNAPSGSGRNAERNFRKSSQRRDADLTTDPTPGFTGSRTAGRADCASWGRCRRRGLIVDVRTTTHTNGVAEHEVAKR